MSIPTRTRASEVCSILAITFNSASFPACYGTGLTSNAILKRCAEHKVEWHHIAPGTSMKIGFVESFNARTRDECLNEEILDTLADARRKPAIWRYDYDNVRPHSALGNTTPSDARRAPEQSEGSAPDALARPETDHCNTQELSL